MYVKKYGKRRGLQRYQCRLCRVLFQSERRHGRTRQRLWSRYIWNKQNLKQLAHETKRSTKWIRAHLDATSTAQQDIHPQPTVVVADTTFWGKSYGVCVFRSPELKKNIWWHEVESERAATYHYGRKILEDQGWTFMAAVVDGRRGLARVFDDIPVQICQFHQMKRVTKYLTRRPETIAGQKLRAIMLTLPQSTEKTFTKILVEWHEQWNDFINEKTRIAGCNRWHYTHKNVRSAYRSLKNNLPYLFMHRKYPNLNIPNTTNSLDGMFSQLKSRLAVHRGLRRDRRYKAISEILTGDGN